MIVRVNIDIQKNILFSGIKIWQVSLLNGYIKYFMMYEIGREISNIFKLLIVKLIMNKLVVEVMFFWYQIVKIMYKFFMILSVSMNEY